MTAEDVRQFFEQRNIRLRHSVDCLELETLLQVSSLKSDSFLVSLLKKFDGFDGDFDAKSMISIWPCKDIVSNYNNEDVKRLIFKFADYAFSTDVYYYWHLPEKELIFSELEGRKNSISVEDFFSRWAAGNFDNGQGVF